MAITNEQLETLARTACVPAVSGGFRYLLKQGIDANGFTDGQRARWAELVREAVESAMSDALRDFKEAHEVNMDAAGIASFRASMVLAGISAAKKLAEELKA